MHLEANLFPLTYMNIEFKPNTMTEGLRLCIELQLHLDVILMLEAGSLFVREVVF